LNEIYGLIGAHLTRLSLLFCSVRGSTPIQQAADFGHVEIIRYLVSKGAKVRETRHKENEKKKKTKKKKNLKKILSTGQCQGQLWQHCTAECAV
jgi:hypothetical protein